jgi:anti-anti-sigma factor
MTPCRTPSTSLPPVDGAARQTVDAAATGSFRGGVFAVTLTGDIDLMVEAMLQSLVARFRDSRSGLAIVDVRAVTFIGSPGLTFLQHLQDIAKDRDGSVTALGASEVCLRTFALVGLDASLTLLP